MRVLDVWLNYPFSKNAMGRSRLSNRATERFAFAVPLWLAGDDEGNWIRQSSAKLNTELTHQYVLSEIG